MSNRAKRRELESKIRNGKKVDSSVLRYEVDYDYFRKLISSTPKARLNDVFLDPLPKRPQDLDKSVSKYEADKFLHELDWYFLRSITFKEELNKFIDLKDLFDKHLLLSRYDSCEEILDIVEKDICFSFWGFKARLLLAELKTNTDKNRDTLKTIRERIKSPNLSILLYYTSLRYEVDLTSSKYDSYIDFHLKKHSSIYPKRLVDYVRYTLLPNIRDRELEFSFILAQDVTLSVIDTYLLLRKVLSVVIANKDMRFDEYLKKRSEEMALSIRDGFWQRIIQYSHDQRPTYHKLDRAINLLFEGNEMECRFFLVKELIESPNDPNLFLMYALVVLKLDGKIDQDFSKNTILYKLLSSFCKVIQKESDYSENIETVAKLTYMLDSMDCSSGIEALLNSERNFLNSDASKVYNYLLTQYTPLIELVKLDELNKMKLFGVSNFFYTRLLIEKLIGEQFFEEALSLLIQNEEEFIRKIHDKVWWSRNRLECYLRLERLSEAADVVVDFYFSHNRIFDSIVSKQLVDALQLLDGNMIYRNISIPILFSIYNLSSGTIYDSIANFLIQNKLKYPSDLIRYSDRIESERVLYFLHKVCSIENIQDSPFLDKIEKVEQERILLLNQVKKIKPQLKDEANIEIFEITQNATVRECLQSIYDSRIFVETNGVKSLLLGKLADYFERYLSITDFTFQDYSLFTFNKGKENEITSKKYTYITYFSPPISEAEYEIIAILNESRVLQSRHKNAIDAPYSRYLAFCDIFEVIKNEFLFNEDYGLKFFLSMRIRHGTLPNFLRNVFERQSLIINEGISKERIISHWFDKIHEADQDIIRVEFIKRLESFTMDIDNITAKGVSWVRIKESDTDPNPMFDFTYSQNEMYYIFRNEMGYIDRFDQLIDAVFDNLWRKVAGILERLKNRFVTELLNEYLDKISKLQEDADRLTGDKTFYYLNDVLVTAKTDIQAAIYKSLNWFNISKVKNIGEIPLSAIIRTSKEYLNIINSDIFNKHIVYTESINFDYNIKGEYFVIFCDLFNTLLDNVVKHTRDLARPNCSVVIVDNLDEIVITVSNDYLKPYTDDKIGSWNIMLNDRTETYDASFEENSGFPKLKKILSNDLNFHNYKFNVALQSNRFSIQMSFNYQNLIVCAA